MERLLLCHTAEPGIERNGSPPGGSTFTTCAPCSASMSTPRGPAIPVVRSMMLMPASAPSATWTPGESSSTAMAVQPSFRPTADIMRPRLDRARLSDLGLTQRAECVRMKCRAGVASAAGEGREEP